MAKVGRVMVYTPTYDGVVPADYVTSAISTIVEATEHNMIVDWRVWPNTGNISLTRSRAANEFLETPDATHLVFIDSDMGGWTPGAFFRLVTSDKQVCGIPYVKKLDTVCAWTHQAYHNEIGIMDKFCKETGFVQCLRIGTGFTCIKREVIEGIIENYKERKGFAYYEYPQDHMPGEKSKLAYNVFETTFTEHRDVVRRWSEDYMFCEMARECGFTIWVDPESQVYHYGRRGWTSKLEIPRYEECSEELSLQKTA